METFGERLERLREGKGYTQKEMAIKLGLHPSSYFKYEKDKSSPKMENLVELADILDCDLRYLIAGDGIDYEAEKQALKEAGAHEFLKMKCTEVVDLLCKKHKIEITDVKRDAAIEMLFYKAKTEDFTKMSEESVFKILKAFL